MFDPFDRPSGSGLDGNDDLGLWPMLALAILLVILICAGIGAVVVIRSLIHG